MDGSSNLSPIAAGGTVAFLYSLDQNYSVSDMWIAH